MQIPKLTIHQRPRKNRTEKDKMILVPITKGNNQPNKAYKIKPQKQSNKKELTIVTDHPSNKTTMITKAINCRQSTKKGIRKIANNIAKGMPKATLNKRGQMEIASRTEKQW